MALGDRLREAPGGLGDRVGCGDGDGVEALVPRQPLDQRAVLFRRQKSRLA
jgi:hypothetical protein